MLMEIIFLTLIALRMNGNRRERTICEIREREGAGRYVLGHSEPDPGLQEELVHLLMIAVFSVQAAYFHSLSRRYCSATLSPELS